MSRSGYDDDGSEWDLICYRGRVASAIRGKRGQAFLLELLSALDAMPEKKLAAESLKYDSGAVCSLGAVAVKRGLGEEKIKQLDQQFEYENHRYVACEFGIAEVLVREIVYMNDEAVWNKETPEERFVRMRKWVVDQIRPVPIDGESS